MYCEIQVFSRSSQEEERTKISGNVTTCFNQYYYKGDGFMVGHFDRRNMSETFKALSLCFKHFSLLKDQIQCNNRLIGFIFIECIVY